MNYSIILWDEHRIIRGMAGQFIRPCSVFAKNIATGVATDIDHKIIGMDPAQGRANRMEWR